MGDFNENLLKAVKHYQNNLDKYADRKSYDKMLHCIDRLSKLPIRVTHLEQTGVGKTVNALRKIDGKVGEAAKVLITQWKRMVVGEQEQEQYDDEEEDEDDDDIDEGIAEDVGDTPESTSSEDEGGKRQVNTNFQPNYSSDDNKNDTKGDNSKSSDKHRNDDEQGTSKHRECNLEDEKRHKSRKLDNSLEEEVRKHKSHSKADGKKHRKRVESSSDEDERKHKSHNRHSSEDDERKQKSSLNDEEKQHNKHKRRHEEDDDSHQKVKERKKKKHDEESKKAKHENKSCSNKQHKKDKHKKEEKKLKDKNESKIKNKTDLKEKRKVQSSAVQNGIGFEMGSMSFAEALDMCTPSSSKSGSKSRKPTTNNLEKNVCLKEKTSDVPKLLKEPTLDPIDINLSSLLPPITPNYRPLGNIFTLDNQAKKNQTDYDQLSTIITSKTQRTKVYSGNKTGWSKVPTLFELCIRILQDNIDALEYTGGIPYVILKPILDKATPNQLFVLEHHNPYLIEDTDDLWRLHCQKDFRNKKPEELESWREMYMRCLDEREAKLKALTANIKQSQDKSLPVRTTKLAYVDDVAKPPRNIAKRQKKNGIGFDKKPVMTPSARLASLATSGEAGKVSVPNPGARAMDRANNHSTNKPKKAPLMLKSLSLLKNRFRR